MPILPPGPAAMLLYWLSAFNIMSCASSDGSLFCWGPKFAAVAPAVVIDVVALAAAGVKPVGTTGAGAITGAGVAAEVPAAAAVDEPDESIGGSGCGPFTNLLV